MAKLTDKNIRPVPQFMTATPSLEELKALADAVYELQRVVVYLNQEVERLEESKADKRGAAKKSTE